MLYGYDMKANKLLNLILNVLSINLILLLGSVNSALDNIDRYASETSRYNDGNLMKHQSHVGYKRAKRQDDTVEASYILNGFLENGTIPVNFPLDICLFELNGILYASALHFSNYPHSMMNQSTLLTVYMNVQNGAFVEIFTQQTKSALDMDCLAMNGIGYIAISNTIDHDVVDLSDGSPVLEVIGDTVNVVQYFSMPFQNKVYLRRYGNNLYFVQLFFSQPNTPNICPLFKWSENHFDLIGELPCTNAMKMEQFDIESDVYVAIANNRDEFGETDTFSYIYKYNIEHKRFMLHQQIRTNAAVDVNHFTINDEHFLVFANSYEKRDNGEKNLETESVIYKFSNDYFTPFQTIMLYGVEQFLPVSGPRNEFVLLISCKDQATKSWQYNGWLFYESDIQFTGGALGQGVSAMRTYPLQGSVALVVANTLMLKEASNIFFPQFVLKERPRVVQQTIDSWCDANKVETNTFEDAKNLAMELEKLPKKSVPNEQTVNEINFLEEVTIDTITTKLFTMKGLVVDQQLSDKINEMLELIDNLNKRIANIEQLSSTAARNTMSDESKDSSTIFQNDDNVLQSEAQLVDDNENVLQLDELTIDSMIVIDYINGHPFADLVLANRDLNVTEVVVNELILKNHQNFMEIIGKSSENLDDEEDMVKAASESFVVPPTTDGVVDELKANSLLIDGTINRLDLSVLNEFALKIRGDQILLSDINFENLQAVSLQASIVSNKQINDIVRTVNCDVPLTVDGAIQFAGPVFINELIVNQRLNNINVVKGDFNVLLKRSDHDQVIQALKVFDDVKLLSPIVLQGKITKSNLNKINPIVSFPNDIVLEGDYEIRGNATINRVIRAENFYGRGGVYNAIDLLNDGLRLNTPVIEQIFEFVQPIKVTNLLSRSINNVDVSKFVRTGEIQTIYGPKNFTGDLHVMNGHCEAFSINDIDLAVLNDTVLKRSGAQKIDGKINFNSVRVKRASAKTVNLFGRKFSDFLTKTDQIIPGNVTINGNLITNSIQIENIRTNNKICTHDLGALIADTITINTEAVGSIITGEKFFRNPLTLDNVQVVGNVFQLGTMEALLGHLGTLNEVVNLNGPITLNDLRVDTLTFSQNINGIPAGEFGYQWLLSETNQDFTAPQTVYTIRTVENVILNGKLNDVDVVDHFGITQFKDQPINFKNATFERAIFQQQPITVDGLVSGIKFPNDIVLREADFIQTVSNAAVNDINVSVGKITVDGRINSIDYNVACDLLSTEAGSYALILERDGNFDHVPQIGNLNEQNVNQLYNEVWLSNRNVELTGSPQFSHVEFTKPIEIKGLLNNMDVGYLGYHYVSLSKPHEIVAEVEINGNVLFQGDVRSGTVQIDGVIKDTISGNAIKIEEFDRNVLKIDTNQIITGDWFIQEVNTAGDVQFLINGFNVAKDVVKYSNPINNVTSLKSFESITVGNVKCQYGCTLADVDVADWISKVVFIGGNYTIQGTTVMDAPIFYDNLNVMGFVNNITFTPEHVLLKNARQTINGNVYISNKSLVDNRILPLAFVSVQLEAINGKLLNEFYTNIIYKDDPMSSVGTRMEFYELLTVDHLQFYADFNGLNLNELISKFQLYQVVTNYSEHLGHMNVIGNAIVDELKNKRSYMATYRLQQVIFGNIKKILSVEVVAPTETFDVFVVLNVTDVNGFLNFYIFDQETYVLALANSLFGFQPKNMHIVDIFSIRISDRDFLVVQTQNHFTGAYGHSFFTHVRGQFRNVYEMHGNVSREIVGLNMGTDDCFVTYSRHATNVAVACAYFNKPGSLGFQQIDELYFSSGVVQVRSITSINRVEVVVLDLEGKISVWSMDQQHKFVRSQIIKTLHITTHISVASHNGFHYIAACSGTPLTATHLGSIEIYTSSANAYVNLQSIAIEAPTRIELSVVASTNDLVLYTLTDAIAKPLIVYRYTGITKFQEFTCGVTIPHAQRLNVLKAKTLGKELISLISEGLGGMIIEAKVK